MKRFGGAICLLFVLCMLASPLLISVEANFAPAQTSPTFTGELLPDPYFAEEPYVSIGEFSPEFTYEYAPGSVALIWMHTAGYELDYGGFGGYYGLPCYEYAQVIQTFESTFNESIETVKLSASIRVDCTGDFAAEDFPDDMWEVGFGIYFESDGTNIIRTISDLKNGDTEDIEFMLSEVETKSYFYGPEVLSEYGLSLRLAPTGLFGQTFGNMSPWEDYSGSVVLTITHMSFEIMLEGESLAPPLKSPMYNKTLLQNETQSLIIGIESAGYDQLYQFRVEESYSGYGFDVEYSIFTLSSSHKELRNRTVYTSDPGTYYTGIYNFAVGNDRIALLTSFNNGTIMAAYIQCLDSFGNFFWNTTVGLYYQDIPIFAAIDASGNVFVCMLSLHSQTDIYDPYDQLLVYSLVKLDVLGNKIWNTTLKTMSYSEYIVSAGNFGFPRGLGCVGNEIFMSVDDELIKINSNGEQIWTRKHSQDAMCIDPQGGAYTFALKHGTKSELTRWDTNGNVAWTRSLGWDYGNGWIEYPYLRTMNVGPNGLLHLVLEYNSIETKAILSRITPAGDLLSQDTIFEIDEPDNFVYDYLPYISDIAVTGDGLVHIVGSYNYPGYPYNPYTPFSPLPGTFMVTYELPGIQTFTPISLTMVGVASVLILGIVYDFFFRRGKVPEAPPEPSIADFEW